jgi:metallophosphoesterase (TIGR03767 family)
VTLTSRTTIIGGRRSALGYWELAAGPAEAHQARTDLLARPGVVPVDSVPLLTVAHLSDLHLCDSQSPARGEFLDRWSDLDSPLREHIGIIGSYRPQDCLTVQVGAAMVAAINAVGTGPVGGAPIDWAIPTGDVTDSAQRNELDWYTTLLDGGDLVPDSGSPDRYEGVADADDWHETYWHPDPARRPDGSLLDPDRPRRLFGFPDAPGLLDALRQPLHSPGLAMPWLAVHGNHDQLIQGNIPGVGEFATAAIADRKATGVPASWTAEQVAQFAAAVDASEQWALDRWSELPNRLITPDPRRRTITRQEFIDAHFGDRALPLGHGLQRGTDRAYYRYDHGGVTVLVLDLVNEHGGWEGSMDAPQLTWLETELTDADRERRLVVLASHHTLADLINDRSVPGAPRRVLVAELTDILDGHPCVVLWLNGHTHISRVTPHSGRHGWWEVTGPSLIDFPQQARIVELLRSPDGTLTVAVTMVDHTGELPWSGRVDSVAAMAGLSRQLAANDWQFDRTDLARHHRVGTALDRNVLLHLPAPW